MIDPLLLWITPTHTAGCLTLKTIDYAVVKNRYF
jgi:hypothetical protein